MSGGSWDYFFGRFGDAADALEHDTTLERRRLALTPEQRAARRRLGRHLSLVGEAMRMIEWVDSDDCGPGDELEPIAAVFADAAGRAKAGAP